MDVTFHRTDRARSITIGKSGGTLGAAEVWDWVGAVAIELAAQNLEHLESVTVAVGERGPKASLRFDDPATGDKAAVYLGIPPASCHNGGGAYSGHIDGVFLLIWGTHDAVAAGLRKKPSW